MTSDVQAIRDLLNPPRERKTSRAGGGYRPRRVPVDKVSRRWRYIHLVCGHVTTPECDEGYSFWKPSRGLHFCEVCNGKWVAEQSKSRSPVFPDTPPF